MRQGDGEKGAHPSSAPLGDAWPREPVLECCSRTGRHRPSCQDSTCQCAGGEKKERPACCSQHSSKLWTPELRSNPRWGAGVARLKTPGRAEVQACEKLASSLSGLKSACHPQGRALFWRLPGSVSLPFSQHLEAPT